LVLDHDKIRTRNGPRGGEGKKDETTWWTNAVSEPAPEWVVTEPLVDARPTTANGFPGVANAPQCPYEQEVGYINDILIEFKNRYRR